VAAEDPAATEVVEAVTEAEVATVAADVAEEAAAKVANPVKETGPALAAETTTSPGERRAIAAKKANPTAQVARPVDVEDPAAVADSAVDAAATGEVSAVVAVATEVDAVAARCVVPHVAAVADQRPTEFHSVPKKALLPFKFSFPSVPFHLLINHVHVTP